MKDPIEQHLADNMNHIRELGKKAIGYERHLELLGKEAADSNLYFWMEGYMNSQKKEATTNTDIPIQPDNKICTCKCNRMIQHYEGIDYCHKCALEIKNHNKPDVNDIDAAKMAEQYFEGHELKVKDFLGYTFSNESYSYNFEALIKFAADFAEFHHREKMKELIPGDEELDNAAADYATELHKHEDGDYTETAEAFDAGAIWMRKKLVPVTKTEEG